MKKIEVEQSMLGIEMGWWKNGWVCVCFDEK